MKIFSSTTTLLLAIIFLSWTRPIPDLVHTWGKITMLRVHDINTKYGPANDQIDVEAVIWLDTKPGMAFGFQLRSDNNRVARTAMLDLIRDAFKNNWTLKIDYTITPPKKNGLIIRAWVEK